MDPGYWAPVKEARSGFRAFGEGRPNRGLPTAPEPLEAGPSSPAPTPDTMVTRLRSGQTRYDSSGSGWCSNLTGFGRLYYVDAERLCACAGVLGLRHRSCGVMFAPLITGSRSTRPNYYHSPNTIITSSPSDRPFRQRNRASITMAITSRRYEEGLLSVVSKQVMRYGDDPIYTHYRSGQLRRDPDWDVHIDEQYKYRREHVDARPPQTLALQVNIINHQRAGVPENLVIGRSLAEAIQSETQPVRFTPVNMDERKQSKQGHKVHGTIGTREDRGAPEGCSKVKRGT